MGNPVTVTPILVADLLVEPEVRLPVYVHLIDHPDARILVDTGVEQLHPLLEDMDPRLTPLAGRADLDLASIDLVVSTHLHADHVGGNHLFPGKPFYVQRAELEDTAAGDYTIPEWVHAPGVKYTAVDGEHELLPGVRLVPAPGHSRGMQVVVIETGDRPVVVGGDVVVWWGEYEAPYSEGQQRIVDLDPAEIWVTHETEPWRAPVR